MLNKQKLIFTLETEDHQIDVRTLLEGFGGFCQLISSINQKVPGEAEVDIKVEAVSSGSFEIAIELWHVMPILLGTVVSSGPFLPTIDFLLTTLKEYIDLKKLLGGEKPDSIKEINDSTVIVTKNNKNCTVNNITFNTYKSDNVASDNLQKSSSAILSDATVNGMRLDREIEGRIEEVLQVNKEELTPLAAQNAYMRPEERSNIEGSATLIIRSANLDAEGKWKCLYRGQKVNVSIQDVFFNERVRNNEIRFGNKDVLVVKLQINSIMEPGTPYWLDKEFIVLDVYKHENLRDYEKQQGKVIDKQ